MRLVWNRKKIAGRLWKILKLMWVYHDWKLSVFSHKILARGKWMGKSTIGICTMWRMYPYTMPKKVRHMRRMSKHTYKIYTFPMVVVVEGCPFYSLHFLRLSSSFRFISFFSILLLSADKNFFFLLSIRIFPDMQKSNECVKIKFETESNNNNNKTSMHIHRKINLSI